MRKSKVCKRSQYHSTTFTYLPPGALILNRYLLDFFTLLEQLFVYIVLVLSKLPLVVILLDRPAMEVNLMNYLRENEAQFAQRLLRINSYWGSILLLMFSVFYFCAIFRNECFFLLNLDLSSYHLPSNVNSRRQTFLPKT